MVSRVHRPQVVDESPEWMTWANCRDGDPEVFFPEKGGSTGQAKRICARCSVEVECLEYALANDEPFGVWGGTSERMRAKLKKSGLGH